MNNSIDIKLYSLRYDDVKTYLYATLFVVGNVLLPQLCHLFNQGGLIWLPIYFFTLVGSYKYGFRVGLLTALLSPIVNSLMFGMPVVAMLPIIISKSVLLALSASLIARYGKMSTLLSIVVAVVAYQLLGTLVEWAITGSFYVAIQDVRIGLPGILFQIVGGYACIRYLLKR